MESWQIALTLLVSIMAGAVFGILVSYLVSRFVQKREPDFINDLKSRFAKKPKAPALFFPSEASGDELCQGRVELEITSPISFVQILRLQSYIRKIPELRLVSVGGSAAGDATIVVESDRPLPLVSILSNIPLAKDVVRTDKNIQMALETIQFA